TSIRAGRSASPRPWPWWWSTAAGPVRPPTTRAGAAAPGASAWETPSGSSACGPFAAAGSPSPGAGAAGEFTALTGCPPRRAGSSRNRTRSDVAEAPAEEPLRPEQHRQRDEPPPAVPEWSVLAPAHLDQRRVQERRVREPTHRQLVGPSAGGACDVGEQLGPHRGVRHLRSDRAHRHRVVGLAQLLAVEPGGRAQLVGARRDRIEGDPRDAVRTGA